MDLLGMWIFTQLKLPVSDKVLIVVFMFPLCVFENSYLVICV